MGTGVQTTTELIADVYPLTPLQEGMLFHSLRGGRPGLDILQVRCRLEEELETGAFAQAWQKIVEWHEILRSSFRWENLPRPQQEVHREVRITLRERDWREVPAPERPAKLESVAEAERHRSIAVTAAPLMWLLLVRLGEQEYELIWTMHHLLLDARSLGIVLNDVFAVYEAIKNGQNPSVPERHRFREFINWLEQRDWSRAEAFWASQLKGFSSPTQLLRKSGKTRKFPVFREQQSGIGEELTSALKKFAQEHRLTPNTIVQGAWALLLSRYSGQEDVLFGALRAGRRSSVPGADGMAGLFINTVPVRIKVSPDATVLEWLAGIRATWVAMRDHEHLPLVKAQACSNVPAGVPLFETIVNVQEPSWEAVLESQGGNWSQRKFRLHSQPGYPLALDVYVGRKLTVKVTCDEHRFDSESITRLLKHFRQLLKGLVRQPNVKLGNLRMLTEAEEKQLLQQWNETQAEFPEVCVHELFEEQVKKNPGALAVKDGERGFSYRGLNHEANRLARLLGSMSVKPEILVGMLLERSAELVLAQIAILKAGGAFVPLDPAYPKERLEFMIQDAAMPVLLTLRKHAKAIPEGISARVLFLDELPEPRDGDGEDLQPVSHSRDRAYVIYTSGSTGKPKGVVIEHAALANLVAWHGKVYAVTTADRATLVASPAFDASVWEIWATLAVGASLHIPPANTRVSPAALVEWLAAEHITICFLPTPLAEAVIERPWPKDISLRFLLTGGDKLQRYPKATQPFQLVNHYGPTENTVVATAGLVPAVLQEQGVPSIGRPLPNVQAYILDARLQPVPIGVSGELHLGGKSLARGYLNRPELTAEKFIPNPFAPGRLYKTGDRACYRPDGGIDFLGRMDEQVKIRGYRIELGEIETILKQHPSVRDAIVAARPGPNGEMRLAGYLAGLPGKEFSLSAVTEFLRQKLPDYMVPSAWKELSELPLTANGKVDRTVLPEPEADSSNVEGFVVPRTPTEEILAGIWTELLHVQKMSASSSFFELGGHSLLATQLLSRIRAVFQIELDVDAVFAAPRLSELAARIESLRSENSRLSTPPIQVAGSSGDVTLSYAQERLWFLEQMEPGKAWHNIPVLLQIQGPLDIRSLEQSLSEIVRRHSSLRTAFHAVRGQPKASITPPVGVALPMIDLIGLPLPQREAEARRRVAEEARKPFDLEQPPLLRALLIRLGDEEHLLSITTHHIANDGWSMGILYRELGNLYEGFRSGKPAALPPLPIEYPDYARWQRESLRGEVLEKQLAYWKKELGGKLPVLSVPTDRLRPAVQSLRGATHRFELSPELTRDLKNFSRCEGVTLFMTLLAGFQALLHRYTGQEDILVGSPIAGRTCSETEGLIGLFLNTLVFRAYPLSEMPFRELLGKVRQAALGAYAHQDLPFEKLVEALPIERDLSRSPVFQVMFVLQNTPATTIEVPGLKFTRQHTDSGTAKFDLTLVIEEEPEQLRGYIEYNTDLFEGETAAQIPKHFEQFLQAAVDEPEAALGTLPLLTESERQQLLVDWNRTSADYPRDKCLHEFIEAQAERTPDAIAVVVEGEELSYRELNRRANHLARTLRKMGVGPEVLAGICMERSLEMIIGLLAILKAGGAYVPLDPSYPKERLKYMLEDSQAAVLLTQDKYAADFSLPAERVVCLDRFEWPGSNGQLELKPASGVTADNLAYIIYTSGSTGKPKGVMIQHRNVANFFTGMDKVLGTEPGVWMAVTSICFDISVLELFWTLSHGFKVVIQSDAESFRADSSRPSPATEADYSIAAQMERHGVTHFQCTPSLLSMLLKEEGAPEALRKLKKLCLGGEALPATLVEQLRINGEIHNMYGPTETTVWSTSQRIEKNGPIPIGHPIANTEIYILDPHLQPVPRGVPGELLIGGEGVSRGYLNRPELTAERFVPNPFSKNPGARLYRTGDLARYLPDGRIEFLGRVDHQVKLRGFRIELGEIEAALRRREEIRDCVVVLREVAANDKRLVAYVVPRPGIEPKPIELRRALQKQLPDYMVPSAFVALQKLPLTPNGKIDRNALPAPAGSRSSEAGETIVPAQGELERAIAGVWQELLGVQSVGITDNFFDLGGHSLLMTELQARLTEKLSVTLPVVKLFQYPTVSALAKYLREEEGEKVALPQIQDRARRQRAMLTSRARLQEARP